MHVGKRLLVQRKANLTAPQVLLSQTSRPSGPAQSDLKATGTPYAFLGERCGRQNNGPPKDAHFLIVDLVNMLPSTAKGTLQMRFRVLRWGGYLGLSGPVSLQESL